MSNQFPVPSYFIIRKIRLQHNGTLNLVGEILTNNTKLITPDESRYIRICGSNYYLSKIPVHLEILYPEQHEKVRYDTYKNKDAKFNVGDILRFRFKSYKGKVLPFLCDKTFDSTADLTNINYVLIR